MHDDLERVLRSALTAVLVAAGAGFGLDAAADEVDQRLAEARKAMDQRDFDRVLAILEPVKNPDGTRSEMVEVIRRHAAQEKENQRLLDTAGKALDEGHCDTADRILIRIHETVSFRDDWSKARARVKQCRKDAALQREGATTPAAQAMVGEAGKLFEDGKLLLKKREYQDALPFLQKCVEVDKSYAECHLALGAVYARLRQPEKGADHYREFLRLAPGHERAEEIRRLLEDFDAQRKPGVSHQMVP